MRKPLIRQFMPQFRFLGPSVPFWNRRAPWRSVRHQFAGEFGAAQAGFRHVHGVEMEHAAAFEDVEGVAERAEHGVVADAVNFLEAGHDGDGGAESVPVSTAEVAVDGEGEDLAVFIGLAEAESLDRKSTRLNS